MFTRMIAGATTPQADSMVECDSRETEETNSWLKCDSREMKETNQGVAASPLAVPDSNKQNFDANLYNFRD